METPLHSQNLQSVKMPGNTPASRLLTDASIIRLVQIAINEDVGSGDVTTELTVPADAVAAARFIVKQDGIICGLPILELVLRQFSKDFNLELKVNEGDYADAGTVVATVDGPAHALLGAERTCLNFIQRMSGVATKTRAYADRIAGTAARILDTRKTIPGWRLLDKYATSVGGAINHRVGLYDMVMIKDNHITASGSIGSAVNSVVEELRGRSNLKVEVEARNLDDVEEIMRCGGIDRIMFDNFTPQQVHEGVMIVDRRMETEASGGITFDNIYRYAETGVDFISVGAITHSAAALDISMKLYVPRSS
ncbi:MAG: carboxylating nicotinate-nucleotide diphosphorylase [Ignavibacteria bacterium]|nr:carboxylating nicotinate-nucleotide diphosphorylase [Ignavibacteria bacterium]